MIPENYESLIEKLIGKTRRDKLTWEVGTNEKEHLTTLQDKTIVLKKRGSPDPSAIVSDLAVLPGEGHDWNQLIVFYLKDEDGETLDSFRCSDLEEGWEKMERLFHLAHAHATNVKEAIEELEDRLDSL